MFTIKADMSRFSADMDKKLSAIIQGIEEELDANAEEIAANARGDVPKNMGGLVQSISVNRDSSLQRSVVATKFYAPFVEFGTGNYAASYVSTLPPEVQEYAMTFFISGKGRMPAAPFMFPNVIRQLPKLEDRIVNVINSA